MRVTTGLLALSLLFAGAATAVAQTPEEQARAQASLDEGLQAASDGRWEQARDAFREAYDIVPQPLLLMNLAGALVHTGQLTRAAAAYERFLSVADPQKHAAYLPRAREALEEVRRRIPTVRVWVEGAEPGDQVVVDGEAAAVGSPFVTTVDPGDHRVWVERDGRRLAPEEFEASEGEVVELRLRVARETATPVQSEPAAEPAAPAPLPRETAAAAVPPTRGSQRRDEDRGEDTLWSSPWTWVGIGGAAALVLVTALAVGLGGGGGQPFEGSLEPGVLEVP